jgi:hypothetical protein
MGVKQGTTVPIYSADNLYGTGTRSKGSAGKETLKALYPDSPVWNQEDTSTGDDAFSLAEEDGKYDSALRAGYQTVLDAARSAGAPNLADVATPADQPEGDGVIVSPYMPNVATGQGSGGTDAVPTDRSGTNGSITSPSTDASAYSLTAVPADSGTATTDSDSEA